MYTKTIYFIFICSAVILLSHCKQSAIKIQNQNGLIRTVDVMVVHSQKFVKTKIIYGYANAYQNIHISSEVPGKIIAIDCHPGDFVHAGQLLIELDHSLISAKLMEENAKKIYQEENYKRNIQLYEHHLISRDLVSQLKSQLEQTIARIKQLSIQEKKYYIRAPFDGVVGINQLLVGQLITTGEILFSISNESKLYLDFELNETNAQSNLLGLFVNFPGYSTVGKVIAIDNEINMSTHALLARVEIQNNNHQIRSGTFLAGNLNFLEYVSAIKIPLTALHETVEGTAVFVIKKNKAISKMIDVLRLNDQAIVKTGLQEGDEIVALGPDQLINGETVKVRFYGSA